MRCRGRRRRRRPRSPFIGLREPDVDAVEEGGDVQDEQEWQQATRRLPQGRVDRPTATARACEPLYPEGAATPRATATRSAGDTPPPVEVAARSKCAASSFAISCARFTVGARGAHRCAGAARRWPIDMRPSIHHRPGTMDEHVASRVVPSDLDGPRAGTARCGPASRSLFGMVEIRAGDRRQRGRQSAPAMLATADLRSSTSVARSACRRAARACPGRRT